jgi:phosphoglycerol transferase MdoB-like AlkP superfamily enzyme
MPKPQGYDAHAVQMAIPFPHPLSGSAPAVRPHVVLVLSESFWNPARIAGVHFDRDLLQNFHALQNETAKQASLSCTIGGMTCNAEWEMLTGFSMSLLDAGAVPYNDLIDRPVPALPWVFAAHGYKTIAAHPYLAEYWRREQVYPYLGFQEFRALPAFANAERRGPYVSDMALMNYVGDLLEEANEPMFVFAITMQNHSPYEKERYEQQTVTAPSNLPGDEGDGLLTYAQGVYDADQALGALVTRLKTLRQPTVLV